MYFRARVLFEHELHTVHTRLRMFRGQVVAVIVVVVVLPVVVVVVAVAVVIVAVVTLNPGC